MNRHTFKHAVTVLVLICFLVSTASASIRDYVNNQVNQINSSAKAFQPNKIQTQARNIYTFGGYRDNYELRGRIHPVQITLPDVSFGCGGLDISWGGISALSFDEIVSTFQHILEAAPAFAFNAAMSILCKDCEGIMNSLQKSASMLNSIALDKCQAAQSAKKLGTLLGQSIAPSKSTTDGVSKSVLSHIGSVKDTIKEGIDFINTALDTGICIADNNVSFIHGSHSGACKAKSGFSPGSFIKDTFKEIDLGVFSPSDKADLEILIRGVYGDILTSRTVTSPGNQYSTNVIPIIPGTAFNSREFIVALLAGDNYAGSLRGLKVEVDTEGNPYPPENVPLIDTHFSSITADVLNSYIQASNKILTQAPLVDSDTKYMFIADFPAYKAINIFTAYNTVNEEALGALSDYVGVKIACMVFEQLLSKVLQAANNFASTKNSLSEDDDKSFRVLNLMRDAMKDDIKFLRDLRNSNSNKLLAQLDQAKKIEDLNAKVLKSIMASSLSSQYMFSKIYGSR